LGNHRWRFGLAVRHLLRTVSVVKRAAPFVGFTEARADSVRLGGLYAVVIFRKGFPRRGNVLGSVEVIERRGLGKVSYKTIARARVRLGLED
jgi:hypothetical protein